ncbi:MAG: 4-hydroxy-tetrahydrodipicolinate reductase [Bacteroidetes bacterium]|nr:4-hydroxy-tetrahydrodipicolinate reductase [Bacteroidota bacterium]
MKIILAGYGKMGKAIEEIALTKGHEIVLKIHSGNPDDFTTENIQRGDVCIDFSHPKVAVSNILSCFNAGVPIVSGTTGWLNHWREVTDACKEKNGGFLYASNFSIGVNLFFELNDFLAGIMKDKKEFNVSIEEVHHVHKKDSPSGTAITLANQIIDINPDKEKWVNAESEEKKVLPIISKREDEIAGIHIVKYFSGDDEIVIRHNAFNRKGFAIGALAAAEFMQQKRGIFSMNDVLNQLT